MAEQELKPLLDIQSVAFKHENDLVKHNLVVFKGGENALQVGRRGGMLLSGGGGLLSSGQPLDSKSTRGLFTGRRRLLPLASLLHEAPSRGSNRLLRLKCNSAPINGLAPSPIPDTPLRGHGIDMDTKPPQGRHWRGSGAQVLPPVLDLIPEARLNLVVYHLKNDEVHEANALIKDLEPVTPQARTPAGFHRVNLNL